ncbi:hypothetical protein BH18THE2_BH18THE2_15050 [soil metagenome]
MTTADNRHNYCMKFFRLNSIIHKLFSMMLTVLYTCHLIMAHKNNRQSGRIHIVFCSPTTKNLAIPVTVLVPINMQIQNA